MDITSPMELQHQITSRTRSCREIVQERLACIERDNSEIHAFNDVFAEEALSRADSIDAKVAAGGTLRPLEGVPVAVKDNINVKGYATECASAILRGYRSTYDAHVVDRLREEGLIILGKTNLDEFAMGSSTENSAVGPTRNPLDRERVPGGSSGGSAAAVAAGMAPLGLGSDTGGSIRQPASFCGVVGVKPTYGLVSRFGLVAFGSSLDQIGPFSADVRGGALLLNAICGYDKRDSTSLNIDYPDFTEGLAPEPQGLRIGIPREYVGDGISDDVGAAFEDARRRLSDAGAEVVDVSLPHSAYAVEVYYIVATAEASANLARFDGVRYGRRSPESDNLHSLYLNSRSEGFGDEVKRRIMLGTFVLSAGYYDAYYKKALQVRRLIAEDFDRAFVDVDVLMTPTSPTTAFRFGEKTDDPIQMYLSDINTVSVNLAGLPAVSLPAPTGGGLPAGIQFIGQPLADARVLRSAYVLEQLLKEGD